MRDVLKEKFGELIVDGKIFVRVIFGVEDDMDVCLLEKCLIKIGCIVWMC